MLENYDKNTDKQKNIRKIEVNARNKREEYCEITIRSVSKQENNRKTKKSEKIN